MSPVVLTSVYLGNVQHYSKLLHYPTYFTEVHDHYLRRTARNRCRIATDTGGLDLVIPVESTGTKTALKDIVIAAEKWQRVHWQAICTAYNSSPFLPYYEADLAPFYHRPYRFLVDFCEEIQDCVCHLLGLNSQGKRTEHYEVRSTEDFRFLCDRHPQIDPHFRVVPYYQVFADKQGFLPNLSILDLLLNMGNESILVLQDSYVE